MADAEKQALDWQPDTVVTPAHMKYLNEKFKGKPLPALIKELRRLQRGRESKGDDRGKTHDAD